ncbi:hypothetical protein DPEC_G00187060 [Dallia pectoralis]|uniref:Uncharacterized protein n=1 Tax=Dallia pectoralis TaxID=75939 RepID=A0ACC2GBV9_DALPE|nr:hypothetical protein DPEC_G00187060 [Dallia pectoralis]
MSKDVARTCFEVCESECEPLDWAFVFGMQLTSTMGYLDGEVAMGKKHQQTLYLCHKSLHPFDWVKWAENPQQGNPELKHGFGKHKHMPLHHVLPPTS